MVGNQLKTLFHHYGWIILNRPKQIFLKYNPKVGRVISCVCRCNAMLSF